MATDRKISDLNPYPGDPQDGDLFITAREDSANFKISFLNLSRDTTARVSTFYFTGDQTVDGVKTFNDFIKGNVSGNLSGTSRFVVDGVYITGNQTIGGKKTFSQSINADIDGNAETVTNGVYLIGDQDINGRKRFLQPITGDLSGIARFVQDGVYTTGDQEIDGRKIFLKPITGTLSGTARFVKHGVYTTGDQVISGLKTFSGQVNISGLEVFGLLTATGDGIFVSDLRITGDVSGAMTMKSLNISGINFTDRYATTEIMPPNPTQSDGIQIFSMDYTAQATGNYLILDTELNLGAKEMADSVICIFRDSETSPIRAWTQTIPNNNQGLVFNMKYFHKAEDTALHTYKIRVGRRKTRGYDPIVYINRLWTYPGTEIYPYSTGYLGDAAVSSFLISEIKPHPTGSRW